MKFLKVLNQPLHMIALEAWYNAFGSFRNKEKLGLWQPRPSYAYGMLKAADIAKWQGRKSVTVCEFGVSMGSGFLAMLDLKERIETETGIEVRVVGFDHGEGLPEFEGHKDHPELWVPGDFAMVNMDELKQKIAGRGELIIGDVKDTIDSFRDQLSPDSPVGFISVDVDLYSAAVSCLKVFDGPPELYIPGVSVFLDDVSMYFANRWCGELAAVEEFNQAHSLRKIDGDRSLPGNRPLKNMNWYDRMYVCHILDHELRTKTRTQEQISVIDNYRYMTENYLW